MSGPAVSVILPVYNGEKYLHRCVESILSQSLREFELIIVDDGSTDSTSALCRELASNDARIRTHRIAHSGVATAFNAGMDLASGSYIARMDADDEMQHDRLKLQKDYLDAHPETGVVSCLVEYGGDRQLQQGYALHVDWINKLLHHDDILLHRFEESPICNPSVMFRRELMRKWGGAKNGDFPEDYEMWLRWMDAGVRFEKLPVTLHVWNDPPTRLTRNDERYSPLAFAQAKSLYLAKEIRKHAGERKILICGAGRITRLRSAELLKQGVSCHAFVDVDPGKVGKNHNGIPVLGTEAIHDTQEVFVVSFVGTRGAQNEIRAMLSSKQFTEGKDFIMAG